MRKPFNVLVLPYFIKDDKEILYAIFERGDCKILEDGSVDLDKCSSGKSIFQGVAGGVEEGETYLEAAKRETYEEVGVKIDNMIPLDTTASVPANIFPAYKFWDDDIYVVKEISFGAEFKEMELNLSHEHLSYKWLTYKEVYSLFTFDSNKTALWELNQRLMRMFGTNG